MGDESQGKQAQNAMTLSIEYKGPCDGLGRPVVVDGLARGAPKGGMTLSIEYKGPCDGPVRQVVVESLVRGAPKGGKKGMADEPGEVTAVEGRENTATEGSDGGGERVHPVGLTEYAPKKEEPAQTMNVDTIARPAAPETAPRD